MTGNAIPQAARDTVKQRAHHRCERCGTPAPRGAWHHRRSRSVRDQHRHCPCNGVWVCNTCHQEIHANPFGARTTGFIVSRYVEDPGDVAVQTPWGKRRHFCAGTFVYYEEQPDE